MDANASTNTKHTPTQINTVSNGNTKIPPFDSKKDTPAQKHNLLSDDESKEKKDTRARHYMLTWNNYTKEDIEFLKEYIEEFCIEAVFQEEKGKEGTPHIQAFISFKNARNFSSIKEDFDKCHIETARNVFACRKYCKKSETSIGEPYIKINENLKVYKKPIIDPLDGVTLYTFQRKILKILGGTPHPRKIYWWWDEEGNTGKSALCKHICLQYPNNALSVSGKSNDIKHGIAEFQSGKKNDLEILLLDIPRQCEGYISWEAIESIKNGLFYSGKYDSKMITINTPHIICFANFEPPREKLSKDRWVITKIARVTKEYPQKNTKIIIKKK